jgi:hypothetical protein
VCGVIVLQAAIGGGFMLISANNITLTDTVVADNSAKIDSNKVGAEDALTGGLVRLA